MGPPIDKEVASLRKKLARLSDAHNIAIQALLIQAEENERLKMELAKRSVDSITGLISDPHVIDQELSLLCALAKRANQAFVVFFLDMNGLKDINDRFGHEAGDKAILEASISIRSCLRESDFLARRGSKSDEFILVSTFEKEDLIKKVLCFQKRIQECVAGRLVEIGRNRASISIAMGFSIRNPLKRTLQQELRIADHKMYRNKIRMKLKNKEVQ